MTLRDSWCRCEATNTRHHVVKRRVARRFDECEPKIVCESTMVGSQVIVTDEHGLTTLVQHRCDCSSCDSEAPHERRARGHRIRACCVKSAMKMATAVATQIPEMIQKRMMTVVSGHPLSSKWW